MITIPAPMQALDRLWAPFTADDWLMEVKHDGYRCMAGVEAGEPSKSRLQQATDAELRVRLLTEAGRDGVAWFPEIGEALALLAARIASDRQRGVPGVLRKMPHHSAVNM